MANNFLVGCLLGITVATAACANETAMPARIHVDVAAVVEQNSVLPVDGITSAGQPDEQALRVFAEAGYVAVIDMRGPEENRGMDEKAVVEDLGLEYVSLPIVGRDGISYENARELGKVLSGYDGPVLLHCGSGNRVGAVLALRESLNGADDEAALEYGRSAGLTRLEEIVVERLEEK